MFAFCLALGAWALPYLFFWNRIACCDYDATVAWAQIATWWHQRGNYSVAWEPFFCGGRPLFGHPQIPLYHPGIPLYLLFGPVVGFKILVLLCLACGFFFFYKLMQSYGFAKPLSQLMAAAWILNGFFIGHLGQMHLYYVSFLFVPAFFLCIRSWLDQGRIRSLAFLCALGVAAGVESYAFLAYFFLTLPVYFCLELWIRKLPWRKALLLSAGFFMTMGSSVLLLSFYLVPVMNYLSEFPRVSENTFENPLKMLTYLIFPGKLFKANWGAYEYQIFIGPVLFFFFIVALRKIRTLPPKFLPLVGFGLFQAILALGSFHVFSSWLYSPFDFLRAVVPGFSQLRVPPRFLGGAVPAILLLAAWQWGKRGLSLKSKVFHFLFLMGFCLSNGFQMFLMWSTPTTPKPRPEVGNSFTWIEGHTLDQYVTMGSTQGLGECYDPTPYPIQKGTRFEGTLLSSLPSHMQWERQEWGKFLFSSHTESLKASEIQLNMAFHPGWKIRTTRGEAPVFRSRRGEKMRLSVPPGFSDFELEFTDPSQALGWKITGYTALALAIAAVFFFFYTRFTQTRKTIAV